MKKVKSFSLSEKCLTLLKEEKARLEDLTGTSVSDSAIVEKIITKSLTGKGKKNG